ncbi:unnamed protein product [Ceutorhynchus assimilis]|uniref:CHK kinase-like domain-containing protein n=1 Tax=Ceutorhynchus assimilis TaxID=467358 RepID=A0A9N9QP14_9CUCU|nr:unnamed protein product [Ceutorhynchus assimilis]
MIFRIYAKFHALSFAYKHEHPDSFQEITKDLVDIRVCKHKQNDIRCLEAAYLAAIGNLDADIIKTFMNIDFKETVANARQYNGSYSCLTHVDYRLCNLMFKYDKTSNNALENVKLINFQLTCASTPVHDLSTIFYTHAGKTDMDKLDCYLRIYYNSFSEFLQELGGDPQQIYPCAVLIEEWKIYSAGAIAIGVAFWIQKLLDENELSSITSQEDPTKIKFWTPKISETREGQIFQKRATDICKHAVEYGIF